MISRRSLLASGAAVAVLPATAAQAASALNVVATTGMIADADIVALTRADLVLWHGLYLEAQMEDFLLHLGERQPVVAVTDRIEAAPEQLIGSTTYEGRYDPHIWMDPAFWAQAARTSTTTAGGNARLGLLELRSMCTDAT